MIKCEVRVESPVDQKERIRQSADTPMKEKLYTIPLNEAVDANDECPFCYIERDVEQNLLDYCLGSAASYMQSDTRDMTDKYGFCREHIRKMYDYGNTLGNAWILKTHYRKTISEMQEQFKKYSPRKKDWRPSVWMFRR